MKDYVKGIGGHLKSLLKAEFSKPACRQAGKGAELNRDKNLIYIPIAIET
jgi:hypothetical protein